MTENKTENSIPNKDQLSEIEKPIVLEGKDLEDYLSKIDPITNKSIEDTFVELYGVRPTKFTLFPQEEPREKEYDNGRNPLRRPLYDGSGTNSTTKFRSSDLTEDSKF